MSCDKTDSTGDYILLRGRFSLAISPLEIKRLLRASGHKSGGSPMQFSSCLFQFPVH